MRLKLYVWVRPHTMTVNLPSDYILASVYIHYKNQSIQAFKFVAIRPHAVWVISFSGIPQPYLTER